MRRWLRPAFLLAFSIGIYDGEKDQFPFTNILYFNDF